MNMFVGKGVLCAFYSRTVALSGAVSGSFTLLRCAGGQARSGAMALKKLFDKYKKGSYTND